MEQNTGGPAFPVDIPDGCRWTGEGTGNGMTLRDYFAAKAMQGMVTAEFAGAFYAGSWAKQAYEMADAMLAARNGA